MTIATISILVLVAWIVWRVIFVAVRGRKEADEIENARAREEAEWDAAKDALHGRKGASQAPRDAPVDEDAWLRGDDE